MKNVIQIFCDFSYQTEVLSVNGLFLCLFNFDDCSPAHVVNLGIDVAFARLFISFGLFQG